MSAIAQESLPNHIKNEIDSLLVIQQMLKNEGDFKTELGLVKLIEPLSIEVGNDSITFEMLSRSYHIYGALSFLDSQAHTLSRMTSLYESKLTKSDYFSIQMKRFEGNFFVVNSKLDSAVDMLQEAKRISSKTEYFDLYVNILNEIGQVLHNQTQLDSAQYYIELAVDISRKNRLDAYDRSIFLNNLAQVYSAKNNFNGQIELLRRSIYLKDSLERNDDLEFGISTNNLGLAYLNRGDHIKGLELFNQALILFERLLSHDHRLIGIILSNIALAYRNLKDYDQALEYAIQGLNLKKRIFEVENFDIGVSYNMLADIYYHKKMQDSALAYYKKCASAIGTSNYYYPSVLGNIAETYKSLNDTISYRKHSFSAHKAKKRIFGNKDTSLNETYSLLGKYYYFIEDFNLSKAYYDSALKVLNYDKGKDFTNYQDQIGLFNALLGKGESLVGLRQDAMETLTEAYLINEFLSKQSIRDKDRLLVKENSKRLSDIIINVLHERYKRTGNESSLDSLLYYIELNKAFSARNNLLSLNQSQDIRELARIRYKMDSLSRTNKGNARKELVFLQLKADEIMKNCISCSAIEMPFQYLANLQSTIPSSCLLISYHISEDFIYILSVNRQAKKIKRLKKPKDFEHWIDELQNGYNETVYDSLSNYLMPENVKNSKYRRFVISPGGGLALINFELLKIKNRMLIFDKEVSFVQSIYQYQNNIEQKMATKTLLAIAPSFNKKPVVGREFLVSRDGNYELPGSEKEVRILETEFGADVMIGDMPSKEQVLAVLKDYRIVHFATHALVNPSNPQFSEILLANEERIYSFELLKEPIRCDLAILSACNTGYGKYYTGEGVINLSKSFLTAGAKAVIMTQWKIPDETTPEIVIEFYKNLKKGQRKSEALRNAKLTYLENQEDPLKRHPYYWAGFVLIGDDSPIEFEEETPWWYWALGAILLLSVAVQMYKRRLVTRA